MPAHIHVDTCLKGGGPISKYCTCPHCTLCVCKVCSCYEGSLTTDCFGSKVDFDQQEKIYKEGLDFTDEAGWHTRKDPEKGWPEAHFRKVIIPVKTLKLNVFGRDRAPIAELSWSENKTRIVSSVDPISAFFERTIENGLDEWVGPPAEPVHRYTTAFDPSFLERLGSYLKRQSGFIVTLRELEEMREQ